MSLLQLYTLLFGFRLVNAYLVQTFFNPDEFYQAQEVAQWLVYGRGYLTWEWTRASIRSVAYPLLYAVGYKALNWLQMDTNHTLFVMVPGCIGAAVAACMDLYVYRFALVHGNARIARTALTLSLLSGFNWFAATRSLVNSMEAALTMVTLYYWPFSFNQRHANALLAFLLGGITCALRPTSALVWLVLGLQLLWSQRHSLKRCSYLVFQASLIVTLVLLVSAYLDKTFMYGRWLFTPWEFVKVNVLHGISAFYGTHPWHWYITQGVPVVLLSYYPMMLYALWTGLQPRLTPSPLKRSKKASHPLSIRTCLYLSVWIVLAYSALGHKEFRFIHPILPLACYTTAHTLQTLQLSHRLRILGIAVQIGFGLYFSLVHQRGVVDVTHWLYHRALASTSSGDTYTIIFLMPCHSTPYTSYIHAPNARLRFLTCEPPIAGDAVHEERTYYDQPVTQTRRWLTGNGNERWDAVVVFEEVLHRTDPGGSETVGGVLQEELGYLLRTRFFNSHFNGDETRRGDVMVFERGGGGGGISLP